MCFRQLARWEVSSTVAFSVLGLAIAINRNVSRPSYEKTLEGECAIRQLCAHGEKAPRV